MVIKWRFNYDSPWSGTVTGGSQNPLDVDDVIVSTSAPAQLLFPFVIFSDDQLCQTSEICCELNILTGPQ